MNKIWIPIIVMAVTALALVAAGCGSDKALIDEGAVTVNTNPQQTGIWVSADGEVMADPEEIGQGRLDAGITLAVPVHAEDNPAKIVVPVGGHPDMGDAGGTVHVEKGFCLTLGDWEKPGDASGAVVTG